MITSDIVMWKRDAPSRRASCKGRNPMRDKPSIKFEIPVPWATTPACIEAKGSYAVLVAGIVAAIWITFLVLG
jgi:hypothetical protein